jgi:riboflavin kinase / FMN adenylyltransferase
MQILRHLPAHPAAAAALTIGNFDGVHLGHRAMVEQLVDAARERQLASCVMTFEPHPREFFAPDRAPTRLTSLREKLELLAELDVEQVHVRRFDYDFARMTAEDFIEQVLVTGLNARWVLVGDDFRFGARRHGDVAMLREVLSRRGVEVVQMQTVSLGGVRVSSTEVRERLARGDLRGAAQLLGRPYSISGRVVGGERLGKRLGFPTANLQMQHNRPPLAGIFVVEVLGLGQRPVQGVASLGVRPTIKAGGAPVLEVHLLDFAREIYGHHLQVLFLHKLRDEEKFADLETLKRHIAGDVEDARRFFRRRGSRDQRKNVH